MVVPAFKVADKKEAEKNSDMGSDCAYFSGPESNDDDEDCQAFERDEDKPQEKANNSDDEFADFQN